MDHSFYPHGIFPELPPSKSRVALKRYFDASLKELYFAKNVIMQAIEQVQDHIVSPEIANLLNCHYDIHVHHRKRLEKIFGLHQIPVESKSCVAVNALLAQAKEDFKLFSGDITNWEIAVILFSHKVAHYKIGSYVAAAHLAMSLNELESATLLAISVQEEEEFMQKLLDNLTDDFLKPQ